MNNHICTRLLRVALALAIIVLVANCTPAPATPCLTYGLTLAPTGIDPHVHASAELGIPLSSVYDTLVVQDPDTGALGPGLAEHWEISANGIVYTFTLRSDVEFHDGTAFDAPAAVVNLTRITDPATQSRKAVFLLGPFDHAEARDTHTLVVYLKAPYAPLLDGLSQVYTGMASPAALAQWGNQYQFHQVGTGPFKFESYEPKVRLTLVRNDGYTWGPSIYKRPGTAALPRICFEFYEDPPVRSLKLTSGEAHVVGEIPPAAVQALKESGKVSIQPVSISGLPLAMFLNTQRAPTDDLRVRQALLFAANRQEIVDKVFGGYSPVAQGPLSAKTFGYSPAIEGLYPYDPERANALLDEAGWSARDADGFRTKDGQRLALEYVTQEWGLMPQVGTLLEADWRTVGVAVLPPRVVNFTQASQIAQEGAYHVMPLSASGTDPDILGPYYASKGAFNWSKVNSPDLDTWLAAAARSTERAERERLYAQVQATIMQEALIIPIRDYVNLEGVSHRVAGLRFDRQGWWPLLHDVEFGP